MKYHSVVAGAVFAVVLLVGVPLYLRTPVWVDVTYHDVSAKNVLRGGAHYRDVFETNLPGMVWLHCLVRSVVGWSQEAMRGVDLAVFLSICYLLTRSMRSLGLSVAARWWFVTAASFFYLYETEFIHVQRDGWMLWPAVAATLLGVRRATQPVAWWSTVGEGLLWGCAVWIKPHVLVPALAVWLLGARFRAKRDFARATILLLVGGMVVGGLGCVWLWFTGAWGPMWDVLLNWNGEYYEWSWADTFYKIRIIGAYFAPFSLLHLAAIPLAVHAAWRREPARALLAGLYLGWLTQAAVLQKVFDYVHAPPTLLAIAVLAHARLPVGPIVVVWCVLAGLLHHTVGERTWFQHLQTTYRTTFGQYVPYHGSMRWSRLRLWPRCWHDGSLALKDDLSYYERIPSMPDWESLHVVADYLRTQQVGDRDVIAWHDSTHPLYLDLDIQPGIRFPHVITVMRMRSKIPTIRAETFASPARFVVSDLVAVVHLQKMAIDFPAQETSALPANFPAELRTVYPWNQPVVYRSGRYVVHRIVQPHGDIAFPLPGARKD